VLSLLNALNSLQEAEAFELLGISYCPSMKAWLKGKREVPDVLQHYANIHLLPLPVRLLNLLATIPQNPILERIEQRFGGPDIYHGTNFAVYPCRHSLKVMSIYDLTCIKYPDLVTSVVRTYDQRIKQCLQWTDLVITISESSKRDIVEFLEVPSEKIWVTPLASRYQASDISQETGQRPAALGDSPYILFVSTLEPRKNVVNLIRAFELLKTRKEIDHKLVLVGKKGWRFEPIFQAIRDSAWKADIYHLGYLSDAEVAATYRHADVFAYPSVYEGFGLPVLEAMTWGCPVVTSNTSSLPEVAGDAAMLVDPDDTEALAEALNQVIGDPALRNTLVERGYQQAAKFSWTRTAKDTLAAYRSIL
jgi:glycosyltransferase involved in cell wall biosynthesis